MDINDEAAKQKIVNHMNGDHQDALIRYLEHYCKLSSFASRNARLVDIDSSSMTLTSNGQSQHRIPLSPSISTTRQARERLIEIDHEAVAALGRSEVSVKEYVRPRGFHAVVFWLSAITFVLMSRRQNLAPGSILYASVLHHLPTFARFLQTIRPYVIGFMLVAHSVEAVIMARTRLRKHTVPDGSLLWWTWIMSTFVEGFGAFQRFDRLAEKNKWAKERASH